MYKNLSGDGLGVSCRQNELIELALTYGFKGIEVDIAEMASRAEKFTAEFAQRFVDSAKNSWNLCVGTFKLPIKFNGSDADFEKALARVTKQAELAESLGALRCYVDVEPASADMAYHDNFELHRKRIAAVADILAAKNVRLGLGINANESARQGREFQFIYQAEPLLTLIKTVGHGHVGLALDTWNWVVGDGTLDQICELKADDIVCVRLADLPDEIDAEEGIKETERLLPGVSENSNAADVVKHLKAVGYDGPVAVNPHSTQFSGVTRDNIVQQASSALDRIFEAAEVVALVASATESKSLHPNMDKDKDKETEAAGAAAPATPEATEPAESASVEA